ncbi:MAG: rod shape-determining protein [Candidatus Doudnabacteria bacterium]|nr:rod shape-determining protein [Candidatus Doudnabacteria bacterium]
MFTSPRLAIDLGTANTVIFLQGKGIVLQEPTVAAISPKEKKVVAVGQDAKEMLGRVPENLEARRPLRSGAIANYLVAEAMLRKFIGKVLKGPRVLAPEAVVSVPAGITSVEQRAVVQAMQAAGINKVYLFPEPIAAALGAGLPINTPSGNMVVNLGGGTAEIAVMSLNGIVSHASSRGAGDAINEAITQHLRKKYQFLIGELMAEKIKFELTSAVQVDNPAKMEIRGTNLRSGMPEVLELNTNDLVEPVRGVLDGILQVVREVLAETPPELAADIIDRGVVLTGGTSKLRNIDALVAKSIGVPAFVVDEPLLCVVKGLEMVLNNLEEFKRSFKN